MSENGQYKPGHKRKKKRSAFQMAKKFSRRRDNNGQLDTETYQYILKILEMIRNEFSTVEDKELFVNNIYEQTVGRELDFVRNQVGSRVFDTIIRYANFDTINKIYDTLNNNLRPLCSDRFASHVIQKLIYTCALRGNWQETDKDPNHQIEIKHSETIKYNEMAIKLCKYMINNMEEFIWDTYGNHILRTVILCLGGLIPKFEDISKNTLPDFNGRRQVSEEYTKLMNSTGKRICDLPQIQEFSHDELTSGFLQSVLYSLKDINEKINSLLIKKIQSLCFSSNSDNELSNIFQNECSMRLLEACLTVSNPDDYENLYKSYFHNKLNELCIMKGANFCVQKLIEYCNKKEDMENIFDAISEHFNDILAHGCTGTLAHVAKTCSRLHAKQGPFITAMCKLFDCLDPQDRQNKIFPLIITLKKYNEYEEAKKNTSKVPLNLNGSLIAQAVLKFNKPIKLVNSLLTMEKEELANMFDDPKGSRIMDAFMDSEYIGEKSREKLAKILRGAWGKLACGVHGSRSLERIWRWSGPNQKLIIMDELVNLGQSLTSTNPGRVLSAKFNVPLYIRSKKEWSESHGKEEKTKSFLADIIKDREVIEKVKKKSK